MGYNDLGITETLMELKIKDAQRQAERSHMASIAGGARLEQVPEQGARLVNRLGRTLSTMGQRLEQYGLPQASPR